MHGISYSNLVPLNINWSEEFYRISTFFMLDERTLLLSSGESMSAVHILLFVVASLTLLNLSA